MAVPKKRRRKIMRNGRTFWWCVKPNDDTYCGLLFAVDNGLYEDNANLLSIVSDDKKLIVSYHLTQRNTESKIKNPYIITEGKEFKGLDNLGHGWERFIVPEWEDRIVTPSLVAQIIDWCFKNEEVIPVDYNGNILNERRKSNT